LRKRGWLPAVVYGDGKQPESISISEWELEQHIKQHHKVYRLEIAGGRQDVYLQDIQFDFLTDRPRHADFKRIDLTKPIELEVEVSFLGHPVGLGKGGTLIKDHPSLRVRCLPTAIPESLTANIAHLEIDMALRAGEVTLPAGVELAVPPETAVCHVAKLVAQVLPTEAPPAAAAEGTPGTEGGAAAPAEPKGGKSESKSEKE
jgi:large subunit ribosomal protein L25